MSSYGLAAQNVMDISSISKMAKISFTHKWRTMLAIFGDAVWNPLRGDKRSGITCGGLCNEWWGDERRNCFGGGGGMEMEGYEEIMARY